MRAHPARNTALCILLTAAVLGGCRATEPSEKAVVKRPPAGLDLRPCRTGRVTGGMGKIAFSSNRTGDYEIYVMDTDGSNVSQLTHDPADDDHPAWSPDGTKIAFTRSSSNHRDVYVMQADGTVVTRLTADPADDHEMAWSPDGARIAFASNRTGSYELFVMNADGSGVRQVTQSPVDDREPAWSPDGTKIAFSSGAIGHRFSGVVTGNYDVFVINADGSGTKKLTENPADDQNPAWSPDGRTIAWRIGRNGKGTVAVMNADGTGAAEIHHHPDVLRWPESAPDGSPAWSPDGTQLVVSSTRAGATDLFLMGADGCGGINLTNHPAIDDEPAWQPRPASAPTPGRAPTPEPFRPAPAELPRTT